MKEKIGYSIGSLLKSREILEFASIVDKNENIHLNKGTINIKIGVYSNVLI